MVQRISSIYNRRYLQNKKYLGAVFLVVNSIGIRIFKYLLDCEYITENLVSLSYIKPIQVKLGR